MNVLFEAARRRDGGKALTALLSVSTVDLRVSDPLHPLFCVQSVEGLRALLLADAPPDLVDGGGYCAASLVFGRYDSTALLAVFLDKGVNPFRGHPTLRFNMFDFALRKGTRADLELLLDRFCCGRLYVAAHLDRALDNYGNAITLFPILGRDLCTEARLAKALSFAREDDDFYAVVAALLVRGAPEVLAKTRRLFSRNDLENLRFFLLPHWKERVHFFCGEEFGQRVMCLLLSMQRNELHCDSLARCEIVKWLAIGEAEKLLQRQEAISNSCTYASDSDSDSDDE